MGWNTGSAIAEDVWALVRKFIPLEVRPDIAHKVIDRFEDADCDTMHEAEQLCTDAATDPCYFCPKCPAHCPICAHGRLE
jgi:hypothetical protein